MSNAIKIAGRSIGDAFPTYFVADIGANHDGDLGRAKHLMALAKEAGADAAKFQHFQVSEIVSDYGFKALGTQLSHQASWEKSVFEVYQEASVPPEWTHELAEEATAVGIDFFSSPYGFGSIDHLEPYVPAYKAGSGLVSWPQALVYMASKGKPLMVSTGASDIGEVASVVRAIKAVNHDLVLFQCNSNYTGEDSNFDHINLNVLKSYAVMFPNVVLGLSDHAPGHAAVLGAVALGARVIEKHFTDDTSRSGPDHSFAMDRESWAEMVERTRELERALGSPDKRVADNERETAVIQRRCLRAARAIRAGETVTLDMVSVLRPAAVGAIIASDLDRVVGMSADVDIAAGDALRWNMLNSG